MGRLQPPKYFYYRNMIGVDLSGVNLTPPFTNSPQVPFYFFLESTTTAFHIKSNAAPFSAFKLNITARKLLDHQL